MIEHEFRYENHRIVVYVRCPKCGEWGLLRANGAKTYGHKFAIYHKTSRKCYANGIRICKITYFDEIYDELKKIYEERIRRNELAKRKIYILV